MSGPIVRKYGFPNFEKIFGERELQHGIEDSEAAAPAEQAPQPAQPKAKKPAASKAKSGKSKKSS